MDIGIRREAEYGERRVGLSPGGVETLVADRHRVYVQSNAGQQSGFSNLDYASAGAQVVHSSEETLRRSQLILSVGPPREAELPYLSADQMWAGYLHLAVCPVHLLEELLERRITLIDYATMETEQGWLPAQSPVSEVAGRMSVHVAAWLLQQDEQQGPGILLSGVPGVPPADVVIVGGGVVGTSAARAFAGLGAQVTLLDKSPAVMKRVDNEFHGRVVTMAAHQQNLRKAVSFADVLIGCILIPGGRTPRLITREMVRSMRPGSVIVDISIDQGGSVETSRPTTLRDPTFVEEGIIHYCVPNMASAVGRTATHAMTNAVLPFVRDLASLGVEQAVRRDACLARGVNLYRGRLINRRVAASFQREAVPLSSLLSQIA
ncbi:MAG: alanine dehydrogenase [Acidobacteriota bacterium]